MKKNRIIIGVVIILIIGLFAWGRFNSPAQADNWEDTDIACLESGHQNIALHIHPTLKVFVDGEEKRIPANIGVASECMAGVHTHDGSGKIHVESAERGATHTLSDFFEVWDKRVEMEGHTSEVTVNGEEAEDGFEYEMEDHDEIVVRYTSDTEASESENATTSTTTNDSA